MSINIDQVEVKIAGKGIVIVALDIDDKERHQVVCQYLEDQLLGVPRGPSTYEFDFNQNDLTWENIFLDLRERINLDEDVVYLWDIARPQGQSQNTLFRTQIG